MAQRDRLEWGEEGRGTRRAENEIEKERLGRGKDESTRPLSIKGRETGRERGKYKRKKGNKRGREKKREKTRLNEGHENETQN